MGDALERESRQRKERGAARGLIDAKTEAVLLAATSHRTGVRASLRESARFEPEYPAYSGKRALTRARYAFDSECFSTPIDYWKSPASRLRLATCLAETDSRAASENSSSRSSRPKRSRQVPQGARFRRGRGRSEHDRGLAPLLGSAYAGPHGARSLPRGVARGASRSASRIRRVGVPSQLSGLWQEGREEVLSVS
jgi:hypothetical protein